MTLRQNPVLLECKSCPETTVWTRRELPGEWLVVLSDPPYALCARCHAAVVRAALGDRHE